MRALQLDYQRTYRPLPWLGLGVLAAALIALALMARHDLRLKQQISFWEGQVQQLERQARHGAPVSRPLTEQAARAQRLEIEQANQVLRELDLPWHALFSAVETSAEKNIALLSLEPDLPKGTVKISGEAKNLDAVLAYVKQLSTRKVFDSVLLQSHQVRQDDPQEPVRFAVLAHWKEVAP